MQRSSESGNLRAVCDVHSTVLPPRAAPNQQQMSPGQVFLIKRAQRTHVFTKGEDGRAPSVYGNTTFYNGSALVTTLTPAVLGGGKEFSAADRRSIVRRVVKNSRSRFLCERRRGGGNNNSCRLSYPALRHANKKSRQAPNYPLRLSSSRGARRRVRKQARRATEGEG